MFSLLVTAVRSLWRNKFRSLLTTLGVIIGVSSVIMLTAIGSGLEAYVVEQFDAFGANNLFVVSGQGLDDNQGGFGDQSQFADLLNSKLRLEQVEALAAEGSPIEAATGFALGSATVIAGDTTLRTSIVGVNESYGEITNSLPEKGEFFDLEALEAEEKVAVLGSAAAQDLLGENPELNQEIEIQGEAYRVIGVLPQKGGGLGGPDFDAYIYIPISTFIEVFDNPIITRIIVKAENEDLIDETETKVNEVMGRYLNPEEDFSVLKQEDILEVIQGILGQLTAGLAGIAAISLLVAGIGIMNIMLVTVIERTREVGLRKALGATPTNILMQFLIESVLLSLTGGLLGVALAFGGSLVLDRFFPAKVTPEAVLLAFGVSFVVGVVFGVYPARKASKLSPIEALRYE